jgi:hypothetical protein
MAYRAKTIGAQLHQVTGPAGGVCVTCEIHCRPGREGEPARPAAPA